MGLLLGYVNGPDDKIAWAGNLTVKEQPLTYTNSTPVLFAYF
jgi:hypothetical protein